MAIEVGTHFYTFIFQYLNIVYVTLKFNCVKSIKKYVIIKIAIIIRIIKYLSD